MGDREAAGPTRPRDVTAFRQRSNRRRSKFDSGNVSDARVPGYPITASHVRHLRHVTALAASSITTVIAKSQLQNNPWGGAK